MKSVWTALALVAPALAGCFGAVEPSAPGSPAGFVLDLPIHVVTVGFDGFDEAKVRERLVQPGPSFKLSRAQLTGAVEPEPIQYAVEYRFHTAPESFAERLFSYAESIAKPDAPDRFLREYDQAGPRRICPAPGPLPVSPPPPASLPEPTCEDILRIDATKVEAWIAENRAASDLEFAQPGYTVFLLDPQSRGYLPQDGYHQYTVDDGTADSAPRNYRAWGGAHDFVFLDVGAGPNERDYRPWAEWSLARFDGMDYTELVDGPIWDYADDMNTFYDNLGRNIFDAARILWARSPHFPFEYAETYVFPVTVFIDPFAHANPASPLAFLKGADVEANTDEAFIRQAFEDLMPWAEVDVRLEFRYLPQDDPGMAAALEDAQNRYEKGAVDTGVVDQYLRENWDAYAPAVPGARTYPMFVFWIDAPSQSAFAYASANEIGDPWAGMYYTADVRTSGCRGAPVCFTEERFPDAASWWQGYNNVLVHELGHEIGFTHAHDTMTADDEGYVSTHINWLWDSTSSVMSYQQSLGMFDAFDQDAMYRAHVGNLAVAVLGNAEAPADATQAARRALDALKTGDHEQALALALVARTKAADASPPVLPVRRGTPVSFTLDLAAGSSPTGWGPPELGVGTPVDQEGFTRVSFPVDIPTGASALEFEYWERDAPSHAGWAAHVEIRDARDQLVAILFSNAHDKIVLFALERCADGCTGWLYGHSGTGLSYEVTITPWFE